MGSEWKVEFCKNCGFFKIGKLENEMDKYCPVCGSLICQKREIFKMLIKNNESSDSR